MKALFLKFLRHYELDVLLLGLVEKLALRLIKKLTALCNRISDFLNTARPLCPYA